MMKRRMVSLFKIENEYMRNSYFTLNSVSMTYAKLFHCPNNSNDFLVFKSLTMISECLSYGQGQAVEVL